MPRAARIAALALLLLAPACAHVGKNQDRALPRHPDGVPILRSEQEALNQQLHGPVVIVPDELSTWRDLDTAIGALDGEPVLLLSHWQPAPKAKEPRTKQRTNLHSNRRDALVKLFETLAGKELPDFLPEPPAYEREATKNGKLYHLAWCDAACFANYAKETGVEATLDDARDALTDPRARERAEAARRGRMELLELTFRDVNKLLWQGDGPWWLQYDARLVHYIDDAMVLIGVGLFQAEESVPTGIRHKSASSRAQLELGKAFRELLERQAAAAGRDLTTNADIGVTGSTIVGYFERGNQTWALALCDAACMKETAEVNELELDTEALVAGPVGEATGDQSSSSEGVGTNSGR